MGDLAGLGRLYVCDERDKSYPLKAASPRRGVSVQSWYVRGVLDQGSSSQCVAYSTSKYLSCHPIKNKLPMTEAEFYHQCQLHDEWPGEDYDGTSVRASMKVLKNLGYVREYRWTWDVDTIVNHVLSTGPLILGTDFYEDMANPDRRGYMSPTGDLLGGHAYLIIGTDIQKRCSDGSKGSFRILNSWGDHWANKGRAYLSYKHLQELLDADGEAAVATEVPVEE